MLNVIKTKKYRGAYIEILNYYQDFVAVIFYRGRFYHFRSDALKKGEYTNEEYLTILDTILKDAKRFADEIIKERSLLGQIKRWIKNKRNIANRRKARQGMGKKPN